ncbi:exocyst complex component EXO70A1 [Cucumis sativus]|uniref:Exocyst subunit Exo70 family protein n=1 Tax=Cucumis sativus TaxID=3659 RepID=A0A0A0LKK3_CUCSA|nr:exocyst complex component EXO70A1 [Cucumis sativus]KGN62440.1 hypothetical protein Csa_018575 [Cucumis sativus]
MAPREEEDSRIQKLESACSDLKILLQASTELNESLERMEKNIDSIDESLTTASRSILPLQSLAMTTKALETRINRAASPALNLLDTFKRSEFLQRKILAIFANLSVEKSPEERLKKLIKLVNCVDRLNAAISVISQEGESVIQKLQEVVEFLSRTKAADPQRTHRLKETMITLKALYETEIDDMKFEGLLDESLLNLQDEFENILKNLKHQRKPKFDDGDGEKEGETVGSEMGSELEIEAAKRIAETLTANDCLDICINIYVKVRYRRAATALMRLNPVYLKTYTPEEIDKMEWEKLETAISLWIEHFKVAATSVLISEKKLCNQVLGSIMDGLMWPECFVKIADKIMTVFFRFGEGVARSTKEPQKLFKLLDMFDSMEKLDSEFSEAFSGEAGAEIRTRYRELEKLLVHASSKVFWDFGLQIEGNSDGFPPPKDGSVPKLVRYAVNYLKYLASDNYSSAMAKVLQIQKSWKGGFLSKLEAEENLLKDAFSNVMEALQRNVESKKSRYRDKILPHIFSMNTYWYIYMRIRNTELGRLLGEQYMRKNYKAVAEESAYTYQMLCWEPLLSVMDMDDMRLQNMETVEDLAKTKMESFVKALREFSQKHRATYSIPDLDLREQLKEATLKMILPAYTEFFNLHSALLPGIGKYYVGLETIHDFVGRAFEFEGGSGPGSGGKLKRRGSMDRMGEIASDGPILAVGLR